MTTVQKSTGFPPTFINAYILGQLRKFEFLTGFESINPILPVQSTNIDDLYSDITLTADPFLIVYDRLVRYRPSPMYRHKREQLIYTIHSQTQETGFNISRLIIDALDREDSAAQDINKWLVDNPDKIPANNIFFHNVRVFQIDETRDLIELSSVKFNWRNKIIIEYDYHRSDSSDQTNNIYD